MQISIGATRTSEYEILRLGGATTMATPASGDREAMHTLQYPKLIDFI